MGAPARAYGRGPAHVAAMLFTYGVTAYALWAIFRNTEPWTVVLWLAGAVIAHDFVFLPLYTAAYRLARRLAGADDGRSRRMLVVQHIAVPAMISLLALLMWLPLILRLSQRNYRPTTGMSQDPYLWRWLAVTGALFAISALLLAVRRRRARPGRASRA